MFDTLKTETKIKQQNKANGNLGPICVHDDVARYRNNNVIGV